QVVDVDLPVAVDVRGGVGAVGAGADDLHVVDVPARVGDGAVGRAEAPADAGVGGAVDDGGDVVFNEGPRGVGEAAAAVLPDGLPAPAGGGLDVGVVPARTLDAEPAVEAERGALDVAE